MPRKPTKNSKSQVVAFKVEEELAHFLDHLPNKSDFIRKAILAQFGMTCPMCVGSGVVTRGVHDHFKPMFAEHNQKPCEKCKTLVAFPLTSENLSGVEKKRIDQFLHGGPIYCLKCYPTIPSCDDCGWHVAMEKVAEHFKKQHTHTH
jgi:hypothetical protein